MLILIILKEKVDKLSSVLQIIANSAGITTYK